MFHPSDESGRSQWGNNAYCQNNRDVAGGLKAKSKHMTLGHRQYNVRCVKDRTIKSLSEPR